MAVRIRQATVALFFFMFFTTGITMGLLAFPIIRLVTWSKERHIRVCQRLLSLTYRPFCWWMKVAWLIDYERIALPPDLPKDRAYVLVANHPSLIDVLFCLGWFPGLTSVVKAEWYRSPLLGPLLRSTTYVAGRDSVVDGDDYRPALDRMVAQLKSGRPLIAFPEGTRSPPDDMLKFHRGPFDAAKKAGVPLVPLFIATDNPGLTKTIPLQNARMSFTFEWFPWLDGADPDFDPRKVKQRTYRMYRERLDRFLADRDRARASARSEQAPSDAHA